MKRSRSWTLAGRLLIFCSVTVFASGCSMIAEYSSEAQAEKQVLGGAEGVNKRVKYIEITLREMGYDPGKTDGILDADSRKAIKDFQKAHNLPANGYIDKETYSRLHVYSIEIEHKNEKSQLKIQRNKKIQTALRKAGFDPGPVNGIMSEKTKAAVTAFQRSKKLPADGLVGARTWEALKVYF